VRGHKGAIQLTSEPGRGTCARLEIPELMVAERVTA
jgi:signal transduction histidine kinase